MKMKITTHFQDRLIQELNQLSNVSKHSKFKTERYAKWIAEIETNNIQDQSLKNFLDSKASFINEKDLEYSIYLMELSGIV